ncbi:siphovirus ReqiPepy6 Gp37-like family protein [Salinispora arenicola]|uniref:siphovirus ReqiPepy6 Gp37-like family protein n=1 Tax=Salinispora arenicola TaxID=168697 RepID=UPI0016B22408|nr:siphovirus ReqiPepy6 Gp37-like family protein [Salinispora arenicola]NIL57087.1 hypothetical protein [Salinispora arenicola]NIL62692.1 hypothetical protein [Salinispora arenicola]
MPPILSAPARITLLITDRNLTVLGDPIDGWTDLDVTVRFNEPASGSFTAPAYPALLQQIRGTALDELRRVVVIRDGQIFAAGPIEREGPEVWSADGGQHSDPGTITVYFADDLARLVGRHTYPDPTAAATGQTSTARWTSTGNAEDIMRALVNVNAGPGALTTRRIPQLVLGADQGVGSTITFGTRFEALGDALRSAAIAGGGLGFRTQQVGNTIEFQVYAPVDLTSGAAAVRFSRGLGNLRSYSYIREAPTATTAIVGGKDVGTSRVIVERTDTTAVAAWERMEVFVDRRQSDDVPGSTDELDQAGDEALTRASARARLSSVTVDTPTQRYGQHYQLGDRVTMQLLSGAEVSDVVRVVHLQATPQSGEIVTALVGSQEASSDPGWLQATRDLARRLAGLETI